MARKVSGTLVAAAVAAVGGLLAYRKAVADRVAEQDLWAEVTDRP